MKQRLLLSALALTMISIPAIVDAQPQRSARAGQRDQSRNRVRFIDELNLTETQQKQMEELKFQYLRKLTDHGSKIASARIDLKELVAADQPNRSAIEQKTREIGSLEAEGKILRLGHWYEVNEILQPEQQKVWKQALGRHMGDRMGRPMMRRGMERGPRMGRGYQRGERFE